MSPSQDFVNKILEADQKLAARDHGPAPAPRQTLAQQNAAQKAALARQGEALGLGKARQRRKAADAALSREQLAAKAQALLDEAAAAYDDDDAWTTGEYLDEHGYVGRTNARFEDATAKLLALGSDAAPYVDALEEVAWDGSVDDVREMVAQRDAMAAHVVAQQQQAKQLAEWQAEGTKLQQRIQQLVSPEMNPQFSPNDPALLAEYRHLQQQARSTDLAPEKEFFIKQMKEIEAERARRGIALEEATGLFSDWFAQHGGAADYDTSVDAFVQALKMGDATYEALKESESRTRAIQAAADQAQVSEDSRLPDGKVSMVSADGRTVLAVDDSGVAPALAQGFQLVRQYEAVPEPDFDAALNPKPTNAEMAQQFSDAWNRGEVGQEEKTSVADLVAEMPVTTDEGRADEMADDSSARLREMEARLTGGTS